MNKFYYILIIWNALVFIIYGIDKRKAINNKYRIKEFTLILLAFLMGAAGAITGMEVFHHKTKKTKFKILVPLALLFNIIVLFATHYLFNA
ncbi:MAG: DUF1294 domain-containing protein [Clostridiales bacterium]|nr:DUF1294 domain-containing protein [Clostridiales bacterium]